MVHLCGWDERPVQDYESHVPDSQTCCTASRQQNTQAKAIYIYIKKNTAKYYYCSMFYFIDATI